MKRNGYLVYVNKKFIRVSQNDGLNFVEDIEDATPMLYSVAEGYLRNYGGYLLGVH